MTGEIKLTGYVAPRTHAHVNTTNAFAFKLTGILALQGGTLVLHRLRVGVVDQLEPGLRPIPLVYFGPGAFAITLNCTVANPGQMVTLELENMSDEAVPYDIRLKGLRGTP